MNDLDLQNRTRAFFSEIRSRQKSKEEPTPIIDRRGTLSDNLKDTLNNWSEYYKNLYSSEKSSGEFFLFPTPDYNAQLDKELTLEELGE